MFNFKIYIALLSLSLLSLSFAVAQEDTIAMSEPISQEEVLRQNKVRNHLIAAREYSQSRKTDLAKLELDSALILAPTNWMANSMMGDLMRTKGDYLHALLSYDKAILGNGKDPALYFKRAETHIKLNNHPAYIISDYDMAIALDAPKTLYHTEKARYYANSVNPENFKTDFESAIYTINEALLIDPDKPELLYLKSKYLLGNKENLAALSQINQAIVLEPTNDKFLAHRGSVNFEINRYRAALTDFNRAININDQKSTYYAFRGHSNFNLDNYAKAYEDYSSAIDLIINVIAAKRGSVTYTGTLNKDLRSLLLFRGMSLVHDNRPYDGCDDFKRAYQMGETKARNYMRKYCN
jgi:tetratricopeptide (TPR) repeat protein